MKTHDVDNLWDNLMDEYFFCKSLRRATEWSYRKVLSGFRKFVGFHRTPDSIVRRDVQEWRRFVLKDQGLTSHTWNNKVRHMRAIYNFGEESGLITVSENPFSGMLVKQEKRRKKTLTKAQISRIVLILQQFSEAENQYTGLYIKCAIRPAWFWLTVVNTLRYTGMRLNQLLHLRLKDVCPAEKWIDLRAEGSKTHREWRIPVARQLQPQLQKLLDEAVRRGATPEDYLFHHKRFVVPVSEAKRITGLPDEQPVKSFFRRLSQECGFQVSPHRFRHTLASILMSTPERNLHLVKNMLGHQNVSTTMGYVEMNLETAAQALEHELEVFTDKL